MSKLAIILKSEVRKYAGSGRGANIRLYPLLDDEHQTYAVTAIDNPRGEDPVIVVVFARIAGDKVIIEEDATDKLLLDALLQQGITREQIILAYNSEEILEPSK